MNEMTELRTPNDLLLLRVEQAKMLKERVRGSCLIVLFIIAYTSVIMMVVQSPQTGLQWLAIGSAMVALTYLYPRLAVSGPITSDNVSKFLVGHSIVSGLTGAAWSGFAIWNLDYGDHFTLFIGCVTVCSITLGGVIPRSAFRPTYVALASAAVPPFALYVLLTAPDALALSGIGLMVYFAFLMVVSAKVEIDTRETIAAKNAQQLNEMILARSKIYRDANADKMQFMSGVSHDLGQPLNAQGFFIEGLRSALTSPEQSAMLDRIEDCWRSQRQMLRGLSEISRLEHGNASLQLEIVDLKSLCEEALGQVQSESAAGLEIVTDLTDFEVTTDAMLLSRIVRNLLANAIKYTPTGGTVYLTLAGDNSLGGATICIRDTGPGIDPADQERIFSEFTQLGDRSDTSTGLGLGLSIVRRLCEQLGIVLRCVSEPGTGSTFMLDLPRDYDDTALRSKRPREIRPFENEPLVLVADADAASREAISAALQGWNCEVIAARSHKEAMLALQECDETPSLLLVAQRINDSQALEAIALYREECNASIPAIVIDDLESPPSKDSSMKSIVILSKPIDPKAIWLTMEEELFLQSA